jgi:PilZ domain
MRPRPGVSKTYIRMGNQMENRKHSRVSFPAQAIVKTANGTISGTIENLSMKGMFLHTQHRVTGGDPLEITIPLSGSQISIHLMGKPIRCTDAGIAIEFIEVDLDSFTHFKNIVSYNSDDPDNIEEEYYRSVST